MREGNDRDDDDDAVHDDSLNALWVTDSNSSRTYSCEGRRNPLESKEGARSLSVPPHLLRL